MEQNCCDSGMRARSLFVFQVHLTLSKWVWNVNGMMEKTKIKLVVTSSVCTQYVLTIILCRREGFRCCGFDVAFEFWGFDI